MRMRPGRWVHRGIDAASSPRAKIRSPSNRPLSPFLSLPSFQMLQCAQMLAQGYTRGRLTPTSMIVRNAVLSRVLFACNICCYTIRRERS